MTSSSCTRNNETSNGHQNHAIFELKSFKNQVKKQYSFNSDFVQFFVKSFIPLEPKVRSPFGDMSFRPDESRMLAANGDDIDDM